MSDEVQPVEVKVEAPAVEPVVEVKDPFAENFARILKQDKHTTEVRQKLDAERKALDSERTELQKTKELARLAREEPLKFLESQGISLSSLQQQAADREQKVDPMVRRALEKAEQLEALYLKEKEDAEDKRDREIENRLKETIFRTVKEKEYDIIEKLGLEAEVKAKMFDIYKKTKKTPTVAEACQMVADEFAEKFNKVKDSKWLKPKEVVKEAPKPVTAAVINKMVQNSGVTSPKNEAERMQAALLFLQSNKK